jgi:predicted XRE-type DNA-binding protein
MKVAHTTPPGANVFSDLGLADAANLQLRAQLMAEIKRYVEASGLTQRQAAEAMKTTQPRLNDVLRGRIEKCSIDRLVKMLAEVGRHVRVHVEAA